MELVEHVAKQANSEKAVKLNREIKQHLGIGNSTGLGMAPFIIKHPKLINKWMSQYTKTLEEIISIDLDNSFVISLGESSVISKEKFFKLQSSIKYFCLL